MTRRWTIGVSVATLAVAVGLVLMLASLGPTQATGSCGDWFDPGWDGCIRDLVEDQVEVFVATSDLEWADGSAELTVQLTWADGLTRLDSDNRVDNWEVRIKVGNQVRTANQGQTTETFTVRGSGTVSYAVLAIIRPDGVAGRVKTHEVLVSGERVFRFTPPAPTPAPTATPYPKPPRPENFNMRMPDRLSCDGPDDCPEWRLSWDAPELRSGEEVIKYRILQRRPPRNGGHVLRRLVDLGPDVTSYVHTGVDVYVGGRGDLYVWRVEAEVRRLDGLGEVWTARSRYVTLKQNPFRVVHGE